MSCRDPAAKRQIYAADKQKRIDQGFYLWPPPFAYASLSYLLTEAAIYMHIRCIWPIFIILLPLCLLCLIKSRRWTAALTPLISVLELMTFFVFCNEQMMLKLTSGAVKLTLNYIYDLFKKMNL